jgi:iron complex outermembrane recepter protein
VTPIVRNPTLYMKYLELLHPHSAVWRACLRIFTALVAVIILPLDAVAQSNNGVITGRVFNPATGEYIRNAEVSIPGTQQSTLTEEGGRYRLANAPAGTVNLEVRYTGYDVAKAQVTVQTGGTTNRDFELVGTAGTARQGESVVTLAAFTVSSEREGNAKAIMEQKGAMNVKNVVATDTFGDIAEGNIGEFLKFMPGITLDYVETDTRAARMGGLEARYGAVTLDGGSMANTSTGGFGGDSRQFEFEAVSLNNIETIEVNKTLNADMPADAPAGSINLRSKSALDRKGARFNFNAGFIGNQYEHSFSETPRHDDAKHAKSRPTFSFDYSNAFFGNKLGLALNGASTSVFKEQFRHALTYDYNSAQAIAAGTPLITAINFKDGPKLTEKLSGGLKLDYEPLHGLRLTLASSYTWFSDEIGNRNLNFRVNAAQLGAGSNLTRVIANPVAGNGTRIEQTGSHGNKKTDTSNLALSFVWRKGSLTLDGLASYSRARQQNGAQHMGTVDQANLQLTRISYIAERPSVDSPEWTFTQTGGADWFDLNNYGRGDAQTGNINLGRSRAKTQQYVQQINARYVMPWDLPTYFKTGLYNQLMVRDREQIYSDIATYVGPTGSQLNSPMPASIATFRIGQAWGGNIQELPVPNKEALRGELINNPGYFTRSFANIGDALENVLESNQDVEEAIKAGYVTGNTRVGRWQFQAGVRYEATTTTNNVAERVPDRLNPFSVAAPTATDPGRRIAPANTVATYPDFIRARYAAGRVTKEGDYDSVLPSGSAVYRINKDFNIKLGYHEAIKRPRLDRVAGPWTIDETNLEVTIPNASLTPEKSRKISVNADFYFEPAGNASIHVFQTELKGASDETSPAPASEFGYGDHPVYGAYDFITFTNMAGTRKIRGVELSYNQQLTFLRHELLRSTRVFATYSRFTSDPMPNNFYPTAATAGIFYRYKKFNASIAGTWTDDVLTGGNTVAATARYFAGDREYLEQRYIFDVGLGYKLTRRLELYAAGRNAFNSGKTWFYRDSDKRIRQVEKYGGQWTVGLKGNF